jgi:hypothetical protein
MYPQIRACGFGESLLFGKLMSRVHARSLPRTKYQSVFKFTIVYDHSLFMFGNSESSISGPVIQYNF